MEFKTKSEKFVLSKKDQWEELRSILLTINSRGFKALSSKDINVFPRLYRMCCSDLAEANMLQLSPDVIHYLNQLVGQAHKFLYSFPPMKYNALKYFFTHILPMTFYQFWIYIVISSVIFISSYYFSYHYVVNDPAGAKKLLPAQLMSQMEDSYGEEINGNRSETFKGFMASYYIYNNISIAFISFALGVLAGLGTVYILIYNGIMLGAVTGYIVGIGFGKNFISFVTAHSVFELTGLIIAGAAGLYLGFNIIRATRYYRRDWLKRQSPALFTIIAAGALLIFFAAFIEAFVSPTALSYTIKATIAILSAISILLYFIIYPITIRRNKS